MVSTATTAVTAVAFGLGAVLGGVAVVALILFLVQRELVTVSAGEHRLKPLGRNLMVAIVPLFVVFVVIVASRVMSML